MVLSFSKFVSKFPVAIDSYKFDTVLINSIKNLHQPGTTYIQVAPKNLLASNGQRASFVRISGNSQK